MSMIILHGTDIETTSLGFGCASLMRLTNRRRRESILNAAFDGGIRHFDVARMYGLGRIENEVGRFIEGRRDKVVIATKFGIEVKPVTGAAAALQVVGRSVLNAVPALRNMVGRRSGALYSPKDFSVASAQKSLEQSLEALRTDYVDIFMLHEPAVSDINDMQLFEYLEKTREKGMIRAWGVAGYPKDVAPVCKAFPALAGIVQIPNDILHRQINGFSGRRNSAYITFSPFSLAYAKIKERLDKDRTLALHWSEQVGSDISNPGVLSEFILGYCLQANSRGVVLFSSLREDGVASAIHTWRDGPSRDNISLFTKLVEHEMGRISSDSISG